MGSRIAPDYERAGVQDVLVRILHELFPATREAGVSHRWGGPLGVPRDWFSSVGLDRKTGLAWTGGYVGDGVSTSNLGGRTLADLILERDNPWASLYDPGRMKPLASAKDFVKENANVAKRLVDYGFHAPTMSWPVPRTRVSIS